MDTSNKIYEIDINKFFSLAYEKRFFYLSLVSITSIIFLIYSFFLPVLYESETKVDVLDRNNSLNISSLANQFSLISSISGFDIPSISSGDKSALVIETIKSRDFLKILVEDEQILANLVAISNYDKKRSKIIYQNNIYDNKRKVWNYLGSEENPFDKYFLSAYNRYLSRLNISTDINSGFVDITFKHESPIFASSFLNLIISKTNEVLKEKDLLESESALTYLKDEFRNVRSSEVKDSMSQLMTSQLKTQMFANVSDAYALRKIDSPFIPLAKSEPNRIYYFAFGMIIGIFFSILIILIRLLKNPT